MIPVSNLFKDYIYAPERTMDGKVSFELLDIEAYEDASFTVSDEASISRLTQVINKIRDMSYKYATFEPNTFLLDGTSYIPPTENQGDSELGWWSDVISGADSVYAIQPSIEFNFTQVHSSMGLTLTFDTQGNQYPSEFKIEVFDATDVLINTTTVTDNTSLVYYYNQPLDNYKRILLTFIKSSEPFRRVRLVEVDFGIVHEYSGETLMSMRIIEEMDLLSSTVPSNEMEFVLDNSDQQFNILNPNGVYRFLKMGQEMSAQIGLLIGEEKYEWIDMGKFYLDTWTVDEGAMTSTFVGHDLFTSLDTVMYTNSLQNTNLYDLAKDVFNKANITNYEIDPKLKDRATLGFVDELSVREALQLIAIAGISVLKQNRSGVLVFEQLDQLKAETGFINFTGPDTFAGMVVPQVDIDYSFAGISFESAYEVPKINLADQVASITFIINDGSETPPKSKYVNPVYTSGVAYEIDNPLINSFPHAEWVANWMFREYNLIAESEANWRQNPALECRDVIIIEDSFGNDKKSRITRQEYNFAGYLEGMTNAKGGV